jgi:hypothetical protein
MRTISSTSRINEDLLTVWNRSGQLIHDLTELGTELASLESTAMQLTARSRTFTPAPERHGVFTVDPSADTSDPRETLAVVKERLRRAAENLERARDLLNDRRDTISRIVE